MDTSAVHWIGSDIQKVAKSGGAPISLGPVPAVAFTVAGGYAYAADADDRLSRVPFAGGESTF